MAKEKQQPTVADPHDMAAKRQLHERADERNFIGVRQGRLILCCGARKSEKKGGGFCKSVAGMGTDHPGSGRCKYCGGASTGPKNKSHLADNPRKHGFYSEALNARERRLYEEQVHEAAIGLQHEIYALKAKIMIYLHTWKDRWDEWYAKKLAEKMVRHRCMDSLGQGCTWHVVRGSLEQKPGYCGKCGGKQLKVEASWVAERTVPEAEAYADVMSKVYYSEGEKGARNYYHAGTIEDRVLDRALNTLSRLVEKQARLSDGQDDNFLQNINKELAAASHGRVTLSWGGKPQTREKGADE